MSIKWGIAPLLDISLSGKVSSAERPYIVGYRTMGRGNVTSCISSYTWYFPLNNAQMPCGSRVKPVTLLDREL